MNTSTTSPLDTEVSRHDPLKGYNCQRGDVNLSENSNISVSNCVIKRYTRSKLFELRNDLYSRHRPKANIQAELQSFGVWKFFNSGNISQNGVSTVSEERSTVSCGSQAFQISCTHSNVRSQRSPTKREPNNISNTSSQHNLCLHKTFIDHRSISSSHLMPAFAKRRVTAPSNTSNAPSGGKLSYGPHSPIDTRSQTPADVKDSILHNIIPVGNNGHIRQRTKDKLYDCRQGRDIGCPKVGDDILYLSPRKVLEKDSDRNREQELQSKKALSSSPVTSASSRINNNSAGVVHERRIGSGRLLSRDVSWDYRTVQDRDKCQTLNSISKSDKDSLPANHLGQVRCAARLSERSRDLAAGGGSGYTDRRSYDRRCGGIEDDMRVKHEHAVNTKSVNAISGVTRRDLHGPETSNHHTAPHSRIRRNYQCSEKNEEPEWFSSGPTSQHDTIELRGFEETDDRYNGGTIGPPGKNKQSTFLVSTQNISESLSSHTNSSLILSSREPLYGPFDRDKEDNCILNISPTPVPTSGNLNFLKEEERNNSSKSNAGDSKINESSELTQKTALSMDGILSDFLPNQAVPPPNISNNLRTNTKDTDLNFDLFLNPNLDPLKHSLMRGENACGNESKIMGSSRFSRWFANQNGSCDIQTSAGNGNDIINAMELVQDTSENKEANTLMEFFNKLPALSDSSTPQKVTAITSVGELEARMRGMNTDNGILFSAPLASSEMQNPQQGRALELALPVANEQLNAEQPQAGEIEAFKKLLEQLGSGNKPHLTHPQNHLLSNLQMNVLISSPNSNTPVSPLNIVQPGNIMTRAHMSQNVLIKNDELKTVMHSQAFPQLHHNIADINNILQLQLQNLSILFASEPQKRLEARNLYQCITRGEVSIDFLEQEMKNPNASPHSKDVISAVLRETTTGAMFNSNVSQNHILTSSVLEPIVHQQEPSSLQLCSSTGTTIVTHALANDSNERLQQQQLSQRIPNSNVKFTTERISLLSPNQSSNHQVIPSQRELRFHTQAIMQNAMIKKKIEEQHQQQDSFRRRQEIEKQPQTNMLSVLNEIDMQQTKLQIPISNTLQQQTATQQQIHISHIMPQHQPSRHINSPTPLAFTPTSVLRKMTAEKDNPNPKAATHSATNSVTQKQNKPFAQTAFIKSQNTQQQMQQQHITTQPRMILGGTNSQQQQISSSNQLSPQSMAQTSQQQPMQTSRNTLTSLSWPVHLVNQKLTTINPMGRPILKAPLPPQPNSQQLQSQQQTQQMSQMTFGKLDFQKVQQRLKPNQVTPPFTQHAISSQHHNHSNIITHTQQQQQLYQHQKRTQALQRHQQQLHLQQQLHKHQQQLQPMNTNNRNICMTSSLAVDSNSPSSNTTAAVANTAGSIINYRDGRLSPTSNQLAQWFSPELLAQASAGKLPLLNMNQALSLEEFEKNIQHSSTTVHN